MSAEVQHRTTQYVPAESFIPPPQATSSNCSLHRTPSVDIQVEPDCYDNAIM